MSTLVDLPSDEFYVRWANYRNGRPFGPFHEIDEVRAFMAENKLGQPDEAIFAHVSKRDES